MLPAISVRGVSKIFSQPVIPVRRLQDHLLRRFSRGTIHLQALRDITISVQPGEWVGCYGPNGSGKTTFLKTIAGLLIPNTGEVMVRGSLSCFFEIGIGFHPEKHAAENIRLHCLLSGMGTKEIDATVDRVLDFADIGDHARLPMKCYSTGMRLRLAFASTIQMEADIYLFDEILAVGDIEFQQKCQQYLRGLREKKKTVFIVSHDINQLLTHCDRVLFFNHGTIVEERVRTAEQRPLGSAKHPHALV